MLEHQIAQLEERLLSARVITKKEISKDTVSVGSTVRLRDMRGEQDVRVPHRRLGRGEPGREQALERVAGRQGDHGPQEGRRRSRSRRRAARSSSRSSRSRPPDARRPRARLGSPIGGDRPARRRSVSARRAPCSRARSRTTRRGAGCSRTRGRRARAAAVALPVGFERHRRPRSGRPPAACSAPRAGCRRAGRRCTSAPTLRALVATPLRLARGDGALPRLRPRGRDAARRDGRPGRTGTSPGSASTRPSSAQGIGGALLAPGLEARRARRPPVRPADEHRGATSPSTSATASRSCVEGETPRGRAARLG